VYVLMQAFLGFFPHGDTACRLPPSENGEWWEIGDESRGGIPYYYHTKTGETVWEKPDSFVIPLTVLQVRALSWLNHPDFK
jgi:WW domain